LIKTSPKPLPGANRSAHGRSGLWKRQPEVPGRASGAKGPEAVRHSWSRWRPVHVEIDGGPRFGRLPFHGRLCHPPTIESDRRSGARQRLPSKGACLLKRDEAAVIGGQGSRHDHRQTLSNERELRRCLRGESAISIDRPGFGGAELYEVAVCRTNTSGFIKPKRRCVTQAKSCQNVPG
jgi:hypothetical protein